MQDPAFPLCCLSKWSGLQELFANSSYLPLSPLSSDFFFHRIPVSRTLGARGFSCAVSSFGQVLKSDTREAPRCSREKPLVPRVHFAPFSMHSVWSVVRKRLPMTLHWPVTEAFPFPFLVFSPNREPVHRLTLHKLFGPALEVPLYLPLIDCSQSPIFSWDRRDIARLTVKCGHLDLYRGVGRRVL